VQPRRAWTVERQASEQDHPRLGAGADYHAGARQARSEALAQEPRQQTANQSMLEMELQNTFGIDFLLGQRWPEGDSPQRRRRAPVLEFLRALAAANSQIVKRLRPTAGREDGIAGVEPE